MEYTLGSTSTSNDLGIKVQVSDDNFLQRRIHLLMPLFMDMNPATR